MMNDNDSQYFRFLNDLREGGSINMFGAAAPLADMYELSMRDAKEILMRWMRQF